MDNLPDELIPTLESIIDVGSFVGNGHGTCISTVEEDDAALKKDYKDGYRYQLHYQSRLYGNSRALGRVIDDAQFISEVQVNKIKPAYLKDCKLIVFDRYNPHAH
jgi:hypothetical protein